jgi:membrane dipeptidase
MSTPFPVIDGIEINNWDRPMLEQLRAGGLSGVHATVAVWEDARRTLDRLIRWQQLFRAHGDLVRPATGAADIRAAHEEGRTAVLLGFQNTAPLEDDPGLVELFHRLGIRIVQLTYNAQNMAGGSCYDPEDGGLTAYGRVLLAEMNRVGILVDCSHVGDRTTREAIDASTGPIAITHANPRWFCDSPRNKPDHVIEALTQRGGVLGVTLYPHFIGGPQTELATFCAMVVKLAGQIGIEHVAVGSDLACGWSDEDLVRLRHGKLKLDPPAARWPQWQPWFRSAADFPRLQEGLSAAGLSDRETAAVLGGNWLRLYSDVFDAT